MIRAAVLLALALAAPSALACWDRLGTGERWIAAGAVVATVADWSQTRSIAKSGGQWVETSPLLGSAPTVGEVNRHFAGYLLLQSAITCALPAHLRRYHLGIWFAAETAFTLSNARIGIRFDF